MTTMTVPVASGRSRARLSKLVRLTRPVVGDPPSAGELRVAQAELVGWLEGLTAAIQSVMVAEAARRERDG
jgi:hypothetical protein